jgi:hypothetical protein
MEKLPMDGMPKCCRPPDRTGRDAKGGYKGAGTDVYCRYETPSQPEQLLPGALWLTAPNLHFSAM